MISRTARISDEIREELENIEQLLLEMNQARNEDSSAKLKNRLYASILSDFYMAVERIFRVLARDIDEELPTGEEWHTRLLRQMKVEVSGIRPPVISSKTFTSLQDYLRFRHLVRNIYGFQLDITRFEHLIDNLEAVASQFTRETEDFLATINQIGNECEE